MSADQLGRLDDVSGKLRSLYFLRRSIGTLHEFVEALRSLDACPEFDLIRKTFPPQAARLWQRSLKYLREYEAIIARVRHHVGGHFGRQAAEQAVQHLVTDSTGALEVAIFADGLGGTKLGFASEIAATALVQNLKGATTPAKVRRLIRMVLAAYRHAVRAVECIIAFYLWDRFADA